MDELLLRELTPAVIGVLVRRGVDFATAEDAVQEALVQAASSWPDDRPADPRGWLVTVAWRKFLDAGRADTSRRHREERIESEPAPGPAQDVDDTLQLYFLCAHPSLTPASAVALKSPEASPCFSPLRAEVPAVVEATADSPTPKPIRTNPGYRSSR